MDEPSERRIALVKIEKHEDEGDKKIIGASNKVRIPTLSSTIRSSSIHSSIAAMFVGEFMCLCSVLVVAI